MEEVTNFETISLLKKIMGGVGLVLVLVLGAIMRESMTKSNYKR